MRPLTLSLALAGAAGSIAAATAFALPGDLDPSFGTGGLVITDLGAGTSDNAHDVVVQPDGKIIAVGSSSGDVTLTRYDDRGVLDPTFGGDGTVTVDFGTTFASASGVALQPAGKVVAAGSAGGNFVLVRRDASGAPDSTFDGDGIVETDFGGFDSASAVAVQSDGKLIAAGLTTTTPPGSVIAIARYLATGVLDATFDDDGKLMTDVGVLGGAGDVIVLPDGRIVVAGAGGIGNRDFVVARYQANGLPDATFDGDGIATVDIGSFDEASAVIVQPDGRLVVSGRTNNAFAVFRLTDTGALDPTFDGDGKVVTEFMPGIPAIATDVALQANGKIVVAGSTISAFVANFAVARYSSDGTPDSSFGGDGLVMTDFGPGVRAQLGGISIGPDGKIVAAGTASSNCPPLCASDFGLARYQGDPLELDVDIDVRPGSDVNPVNTARGLIPVAIMTTDAFDATVVDPSSVCFGDADAASERDCTEAHGTGHVEDANADGRVDLVLHFEASETGVDEGDEFACLTGRTTEGLSVRGCDEIRTV